MANKTIQQLTPLTTADASDLLALYDVSGNGTNSITAANLLNTTITGLETTAKTIPAAINELNNNLDTYTKRYEVTFSSSFTAGTIGTRGTQISYDLPNQYSSGYVVSGVIITNVANSNAYIAQPFCYNNKIYCNFYRATTSASECSVSVVFLFRKA